MSWKTMLSLLASAVTLAVSSARAQSTGAAEWRADVPRVWDDEALATLELPILSPKHSPRHLPSDYYYKIPIRPIYKSYPIYHPDKEPEGYWDWLQEQEPRLEFEPGEMKTREDWIKGGELVFTAPRGYASGEDLQRTYRTAAAYVDAPLTPEGIFPYERYVIRQKGKVEAGFDSCASCHTRVLRNGDVLLGGPGNSPMGRLVAYEIRDRISRFPKGRAEPVADKDWQNYRMAAAPWMTPDPGAFLLGEKLGRLAEFFAAMPSGVMPRERASLQYPARKPDLIGVSRRRYLDASGLVQQRDLTDLMRYAALNEGLDEYASYDGFRPAAKDFTTLPEPGTLERRSDAQLYALALFLDSLTPPPNPNPLDAAARRGERVFDAERCASCHRPPLYSNNRLVPATGFQPPADHRRRFRIQSRRVGTDPGLTMRTRRGTGYYKVPSLLGVWYRGPFFHDGSLAQLEDVFDPRRLAPDYVPTGFRGHDGTRRGVPGHEFGLKLSARERADLLAFLRTL